VKRGVPAWAAWVAGAAFACGSASDAGLENARPVTAAAPDAAAPLDCPPTRVITDVSDAPASTAVGAAVNVLNAYCAGCHAPDAAEPAPSGPSDVTDFNGMIDDGFVIDCDAEGSPLIIGMRRNEMPPADYFSGPAMSYDIDTVATFIELDCSVQENACAESPNEPGCAEVLAARRARRCSW